MPNIPNTAVSKTAVSNKVAVEMHMLMRLSPRGYQYPVFVLGEAIPGINKYPFAVVLIDSDEHEREEARRDYINRVGEALVDEAGRGPLVWVEVRRHIARR